MKSDLALPRDSCVPAEPTPAVGEDCQQWPPATLQSSTGCLSLKVWGSRARSLEKRLVASVSLPAVINGLCLQANHWVKCPINHPADKLLGEKCVTLGWAFYVICLKQSCLTSQLALFLSLPAEQEEGWRISWISYSGSVESSEMARDWIPGDIPWPLVLGCKLIEAWLSLDRWDGAWQKKNT